MGELSKIQWTHATFNPWIGCSKVSPGCDHCYAERGAKRLSVWWGDDAERRIAREAYWNEPRRWNKRAAAAGERHRVFCASYADVFEDRRDLDAHRARLFALIEETPSLDWLLLTKRPEMMMRLAPADWCDVWPGNAWAGTTAENAAMVLKRGSILATVPACVRFLSCEPLLEDIAPDLSYLFRGTDTPNPIHWVILGGESGPKARPYDVEWARRALRMCRSEGVAAFHKQLGERAHDDEDRAREWRAVGSCLTTPGPWHGSRTVLTDDRKGGDPSQWPEDLRVRQFPEVRRG